MFLLWALLCFISNLSLTGLIYLPFQKSTQQRFFIKHFPRFWVLEAVEKIDQIEIIFHWLRNPFCSWNYFKPLTPQRNRSLQNDINTPKISNISKIPSTSKIPLKASKWQKFHKNSKMIKMPFEASKITKILVHQQK